MYETETVGCTFQPECRKNSFSIMGSVSNQYDKNIQWEQER